MTPYFIDVETVPNDDIPQRAVEELAARASRGGTNYEPAMFAATSPFLAKIVCVGINDTAYSLGGNPSSRVQVRRSERDLLAGVNAALSEYGRPIVTFAGRMFDLPLLVARCKALDVATSQVLLNAATEYRFRPSAHYDMQDIVTQFGATARRPSLREVCLGLGISDPKSTCDGASVLDLVRSGRWDDLAEYCLGDVAATAAIYRRWYS